MVEAVELPFIPQVTDPELVRAIAALAQAGEAYRAVLYRIAEEALKDLNQIERSDHPAIKIIYENDDLLKLADHVIDSWSKQLDSLDNGT